ncbi:MAG TPA: SDR family oxidoreductase [Aggregatilineales bacterium]|nr:SDR family oxidoreductase [Anaerolineales bacterium]HRE47606.1 SDR family oxidoreductase [Aggregatilineales bacterium]
MTTTAIPLAGKVALVTGSARRVGRAIALELAGRGMNLLVHHSNSDADAESAVREIEGLGVQAYMVKADLRDPLQIALLFRTIRARFGRLDLLVNNASVFYPKPILDVTVDEWRDVLDVNLTAPFLCSQAAAGLMNGRREGGSIINILDLSAFHPWKTYPHHSVSKAGLKMLTEVLAVSLAPTIRVNAVAPGPVLRDAGNSPEQWAILGERLPLKRTGEPTDVARAVAYLASEPFLTGAIIRVDGGEGLL